MTQQQRFSNSLLIADGRFRCAGCDGVVAESGDNWKLGTCLREQPINELPGPYRTGRDIMLRAFFCPHCGLLLDTELALPGDALLADVLT